MSNYSSFMDLVIQGRKNPEDINEFISFWHRSDVPEDLHEFLGLSWDEYTLLGSDSTAINRILFARRFGIPLIQAVNDNQAAEFQMAARSSDFSRFDSLKRWIDAQPDR
ncbi:hypothetical protein [uncultured Sphingomonas sp.]|uniref:hypothetical protein n=1 Tax=uncultured Sphingomonas sp. TaxID=158754 RepID=UPI0025E6291F|nr:hypothetical protein [uncultured Sphingomonas sp.]